MSDHCPSCDYYTENGDWYCERTCRHPACGPCAHDRWAEANPLEAAYEEAYRISAQAQWAEEAGWENWREYGDEEQAAWEHVLRLEEEAHGP